MFQDFLRSRVGSLQFFKKIVIILFSTKNVLLRIFGTVHTIIMKNCNSSANMHHIMSEPGTSIEGKVFVFVFLQNILTKNLVLFIV
jgi:hypothetical protein